MTRAKKSPLYVCNQMPDRWIAEDEHGELVHWPATSQGWAQRAPYKGHRNALREVPAHNAYGTGWPGYAGRGRPPLPKGEAKSERIEVRCTGAEYAVLVKAIESRNAALIEAGADPSELWSLSGWLLSAGLDAIEEDVTTVESLKAIVREIRDVVDRYD